MRLTNYQRDAFITNVMNDVPSIDYDEQIRTTVVEHFVSLLPPKVRAVWDDKKARGYLTTAHSYAGRVGATVPYYCRHTESADDERARAAAAHLCEARKAQLETRTALRSSLHGVAYSVTTRKALAEKLPEFEKYLPPEAETSTNLPALANVLTDFIKAGWPKEKVAA